MKIKTYQSFRLPLSDFYGMNAPFDVGRFLSGMRYALDRIEEFAMANPGASMQTSVCQDEDEYFNENIQINYEREEYPFEVIARLKNEKGEAERKALHDKKKAEAEAEEYQKMVRLCIKFGVKVVPL
jgi:hypothetical protein